AEHAAAGSFHGAVQAREPERVAAGGPWMSRSRRAIDEPPPGIPSPSPRGPGPPRDAKRAGVGRYSRVKSPYFDWALSRPAARGRAARQRGGQRPGNDLTTPEVLGRGGRVSDRVGSIRRFVRPVDGQGQFNPPRNPCVQPLPLEG